MVQGDSEQVLGISSLRIDGPSKLPRPGYVEITTVDEERNLNYQAKPNDTTVCSGLTPREPMILSRRALSSKLLVALEQRLEGLQCED